MEISEVEEIPEISNEIEVDDLPEKTSNGEILAMKTGSKTIILIFCIYGLFLTSFWPVS